MAKQKTATHYYIGFADDVCRIAKCCYREARPFHLRSMEDLRARDFNGAVVHLIGKWWLTDRGIEIRYEVLHRYPKVKFEKHL